MKAITYFLLCLFFFGVEVYPQGLIKKTAETRTWNEFVAADDSFRILFPTQPEKNPAPLDRLLEKKDLIVHLSQVSDKESYAVGFSDFPAPIIDDLERQAMYQITVNSRGEEKSVNSRGLSGVEYSFDDESLNVTFTRRLFIVGQRFFQLSVSTPLFNKLSPKAGSSYRRKIDAFFNSFAIGKIPPAKLKPTPDLPEDFKISLKDRTFVSESLGFKITLPEGWSVELHPGKSNMTVSEKREYEENNAGLRWIWKNNPRLFTARRSPQERQSAVLSAKVSRPQFANITLPEFTESEKDFQAGFGAKLSQPVRSISFEEHEFLSFEIENQTPSSRTRERFYVISRRGVFLTFSLTFEGLADEKLMIESLKTLTFF